MLSRIPAIAQSPDHGAQAWNDQRLAIARTAEDAAQPGVLGHAGVGVVGRAGKSGVNPDVMHGSSPNHVERVYPHDVTRGHPKLGGPVRLHDALDGLLNFGRKVFPLHM